MKSAFSNARPLVGKSLQTSNRNGQPVPSMDGIGRKIITLPRVGVAVRPPAQRRAWLTPWAFLSSATAELAQSGEYPRGLRRCLSLPPVVSVNDRFGHFFAGLALAGTRLLAKTLASVAVFPYSWNTKQVRCVTCTIIQVIFCCTYSNESICVECPGVREALGAVLGLVALDAFLFGGIHHV